MFSERTPDSGRVWSYGVVDWSRQFRGILRTGDLEGVAVLHDIDTEDGT